MDITINGQPAGITLEAEKTVGDFLAGVDKWLTGTGNRISGFEIDGKNIGVDAISLIFEQNIADVKSINVLISSLVTITVEALLDTVTVLEIYKNAAFDEKIHVKNAWDTGVTVRFLKEQIPDLAKTVLKTLSDEDFSPVDAIKQVNERLREMQQPEKEIIDCGNFVTEIAGRLENLPLDMQTGKDKKALETMRLFSYITEKLLRILVVLKQYGFEIDALSIDSAPLPQFTKKFKALLGELLAAYEARDTVLTGDLAEYAMAPCLLSLYMAMKEMVVQKA
jgi:hypothetical protein